LATFDKLRLNVLQPIEEFHSIDLEKGKKLNKSDRDILAKFVDGQPPHLAFFVRAGKISSYDEARQSAKLGEAYGYRKDSEKAVTLVSSAKLEQQQDSTSVMSILKGRGQGINSSQ